MNVIICPNCGESNPPEAIMCWACYTSLRNANEVIALMTEEVAPAQRVLDVVLNYAEQYKATAIRFRVTRALEVEYLVADEWQLQVKAPSLLWPELRAELLKRDTFAVAKEVEGRARRFTLAFISKDEAVLSFS